MSLLDGVVLLFGGTYRYIIKKNLAESRLVGLKVSLYDAIYYS